MILRWPKLAREGRVIREQIASLVDLMPTLLDLVGGPSQSHVHGCSLAPIVRGECATIARRHAFVETGNGVGIREPDHLYFLQFAGEDHTLSDRPARFHCLASDPYQLHNCAEQERDSEVARRLDRTLREWDRATPWMTTE